MKFYVLGRYGTGELVSLTSKTFNSLAEAEAYAATVAIQWHPFVVQAIQPSNTGDSK